MTDIAIVVSEGLAALGMSLLLLGRAVTEGPRILAFGAMIVLTAHGFGMAIMAPIEPQLADALSTVSLIWLFAALLPLCVRGFRSIRRQGVRPGG